MTTTTGAAIAKQQQAQQNQQTANKRGSEFKKSAVQMLGKWILRNVVQ